MGKIIIKYETDSEKEKYLKALESVARIKSVGKPSKGSKYSKVCVTLE